MNYSLSIIIVNFNTPDLTIECVEKINKHTKNINFEIVIVDSNSSDGSFEILSNKFKNIEKIKVVKMRENLGFGMGNNFGVENSTGENILFINSDAFVNDNAIKTSLDYLLKNKNIGIVGPMLLNKDGSIQATGGYFPNLLNVFSWMTIQDLPLIDYLIKPFHPHKTKLKTKNDNFYFEERELDWVTAAFLMTKRDVFEKVKGFDKDYFMYTEEVDLCYKIKKLGFKVVYIPDAKVTHLGGASSTKEFAVISEFKGIKTFFKKHHPSWQMPILKFLLKIGSLLRAIVFGIIEGRNSYLIYVKAYKTV